MIIETIKEFESGKCSIFKWEQQGWLGKEKYQVRIFTTKKASKLPKEDEINKIVKDNWSKLVPTTKQGYEQQAEVGEYTFLVKKI